jgi:hypothetical protein
MPTAPTAIATPPSAPARSDLTNFVAKADAWVAWEEVNAPKVGQNATATYDNAVEAAASAASAVAAAASVGAALWVSGTTYSLGDVRRSPVTFFPYRRLTAGAGTTDPSADATNWALAAAAAYTLIEVTGTSVSAQVGAHYFLTNAAATTVTLPASPAAGDVVVVTVANARADNLIARNTKNIMALAEDMTISDLYATIRLRYLNATKGWWMV